MSQSLALTWHFENIPLSGRFSLKPALFVDFGYRPCPEATMQGIFLDDRIHAVRFLEPSPQARPGVPNSVHVKWTLSWKLKVENTGWPKNGTMFCTP